ncbi:MAG: hypothetical protein QGH20_09045, partial [Candidatus Latescibacteria bacterium]|nr:hypothetical protein [Candidatus Latescibacterota bacterium]
MRLFAGVVGFAIVGRARSAPQAIVELKITSAYPSDSVTLEPSIKAFVISTNESVATRSSIC